MRTYLLSVIFALLGISQGVAQNPLSVSKPETDNTVAGELKSFTLADGYEANLFADETDGVANPVCMAWDPAGRLWVLVTSAYPQPKPSDKPQDKLLILSDTNGDGRADKTIVFADGLNMPTGFALGQGGAYLGQGNDLLHLKDTDGDDKA
ncbi:sorbosone dehydrogenase, partial [bacterium]|nr:sorbosone dehydrogenase [bacterium]